MEGYSTQVTEDRFVARRAQHGHGGRWSMQHFEDVLRRLVVCRSKGWRLRRGSPRRQGCGHPNTNTGSDDGQRSETKGGSFHMVLHLLHDIGRDLKA
jgi:hypothetical protein